MKRAPDTGITVKHGARRAKLLLEKGYERGSDMQKALKCLWSYIEARRKKQLIALLALMILASGAEIISIGAILPFLTVLTSPERLFFHAGAKPAMQLLGLTDPAQLVLPITIFFCAAALLAGAIRLLLLWAVTRLSFAVGAEIGAAIFQRTLYQPYSVHISRNSSEVVNAITSKVNAVIHGVLLQSLNLVSASFILIAIAVTLILIDATIAISAFIGFGIIYVLMIKLTRDSILQNSNIISTESTRVVKVLQEGLGGIRDIIIDNSQEVINRTFVKADTATRIAQGKNAFMSNSPRYGVEALGMVLVAALAYFLVQKPGGVAATVPILGAMALGAQRLLPALQQAYGALTTMQGCRSSLDDILELLIQSVQKPQMELSGNISFMRNIRLENVSYKYQDATIPSLKDIYLTVKKGARIGIIGETGSGKSTLVDILLGLLTPTSGKLLVDDIEVAHQNQRQWQSKIAHVPQNIYLSDESIASNIAFGIEQEKIDFSRVKHAAHLAKIDTLVEGLPLKYETIIGERGVRLSGGQRQRIGIARALYKTADVIILDEATSALDNETESAIIEMIDSLGPDVTIFMIAHRLTTLRICDSIIELKGGSLERAISYRALIEDSTVNVPDFKIQQDSKL